jgi:hypothetical protein
MINSRKIGGHRQRNFDARAQSRNLSVEILDITEGKVVKWGWVIGSFVCMQ